MNDPPTALVGFGSERGRRLCRLGMNDPPTALVGFGSERGRRLCTLSKDERPTLLDLAVCAGLVHKSCDFCLSVRLISRAQVAYVDVLLQAVRSFRIVL
jgi:hypothetical protein